MTPTGIDFSTTLLFVLFSCMLCYGEQPSTNGNCQNLVFSDVHHIVEVDDYVGTELVLSLCPGAAEIRGEWNEYEGYHPATTKLSGRRAGKSIRLTGTNPARRVELVGQLKGERLKGKLVWYIGTSRQEKKINLVRTRGPVRPPT